MGHDDRRYSGFRVETEGAAVVFKQYGVIQRLPLRLDLYNHSPTGFEWGYGGSGPAQLALALLAHATGDGELAVRLHQDFKWAVIGRLPQYHWSLRKETILEWVANHLDDDSMGQFQTPEGTEMP
jgi:Family of unknown function (DUF6166)